MKLRPLLLSAVLSLSVQPTPSYADLFGGDVAVLVQILAKTIQELVELQKILKNGRDTLGLLQDINRGINDSLRVIHTIAPHIDPGTYGKLLKVEDAVAHLKSAYGIIVESPEGQTQTETDQVVAEAISMNNELYVYAGDLDKVGENIKEYSHDVSPGGAAKLTAQSLGVMIHVMNQQLRATATSLKLSAQTLAVQNKREKQQTAQYLEQANILVQNMKTEDAKFEFPRF